MSTLINDPVLPEQTEAYTAPLSVVAAIKLPVPVAKVLADAADLETEVIRQVPVHEELAPELK
ncbi:hypothetical protein B9Z52_09250 [Limnohabitans sp. Jir72]|nr:hypothetical protein B9Z52_09250 [Limnohabitans sp. Jir72]